MNQMSREYRRLQIEADSKSQRQMTRLKRDMANILLARIQEQQEIEPDVTSFDTPLLRPLRRTETYLLKQHPEEIAVRVDLGRHVLLSLDDSVEPPMLHIELGEEI